jgi:hypothetical protein
MDEQIKHLVINMAESKTPKDKEPKEKQKKVITESTEWSTISHYLGKESQKEVLQGLLVERTTIHDSLARMIRGKLSGYRSQDTAKELYDESQFIRFEEVVQSLIKSEMECFYCKGDVQLFYEYVREPRQWTLDRIDNNFGHNRGNVEISCLECNLRRKTMYHERYVYTKQAVIRKV